MTGLQRTEHARTTRRLRRWGDNRDNDNGVVNLLNTVPLAASDRQALIDARVARAWSQSELAKRINSSLTFLNLIETGKKSPSPDYLNKLCKALSGNVNFAFGLSPRHLSDRDAVGVERPRTFLLPGENDG